MTLLVAVASAARAVLEKKNKEQFGAPQLLVLSGWFVWCILLSFEGPRPVGRRATLT